VILKIMLLNSKIQDFGTISEKIVKI